MLKQSLTLLSLVSALSISALSISSCGKQQKDPAEDSGESGSKRVEPKEDATTIKVVFTYGSEKKQWVKAATQEFNQAKHKTSKGRVIFVSENAMGSGECMNEIQYGTRKTTLVSPASAAFIKLGNAESQRKSGKDLVKNTENLCLSPVIIAMWEPMAKKLGYGEKPIGWKDINALSTNDQGWAAHGMPQWGRFRFGHTHPDYSNSGLISLLAEVYAGSGKQARLKVSDVNKPEVGDYLEQIERSVVHYGKSTGFFGRKMFDGGPSYLSAAVLYENMVIESRQRNDLPFPIVAIYPSEGTFWSDHPAGIVNREWVTDEHEEAAKQYMDFLLSKEQQKKVMNYGFRPADIDVELDLNIFSLNNGVDPQQPKTTLEVPSVEVINEIRKLWLKRKKKAHIVLAIDRSGSMKLKDGKNKLNRMAGAKQGAKTLINLLGEEDSFSMISFSNNPVWAIQDKKVGPNRKELLDSVDAIFSQGGTALYDAISLGFNKFQKTPDQDRITAVVVLTDGDDSGKGVKLNELLRQIKSDGETRNTRVFTIAYSKGAKADILKQIAEATKAKSFKSDTKSIREVFKEISTFF